MGVRSDEEIQAADDEVNEAVVNGFVNIADDDKIELEGEFNTADLRNMVRTMEKLHRGGFKTPE